MTTKTKSSAAAALLLLLGGCAGLPANQDVTAIDLNWFRTAGAGMTVGQDVIMAATENVDGSVFGLGCMGPMPIVMVRIWGVDETAGPSRDVVTVVDGDSVTERWRNELSHKSAFWVMGTQAQTLIARLGAAKRVSISTDDGEHSATWAVGFAPAVRALTPDCRNAFAA